MKKSFKIQMPSKVFKIGLAVIAAVNLAALFLFDYGLPDYTFERVPAAAEETSGASLIFNTDLLTYNGSGDISLLVMDGVEATDADGTDLTDQVKTSFAASNLLTEKKVKYSVETASGKKLKKERTLRLENYEGPTITVSNNLPLIKEAELNNSVSILASAGALHAEDGYGNDITSSVKVKWTADEANIGSFVLNFSVSNTFEDSATAKATIQAELENPVIALSRYEAAIAIGDEEFNVRDYIRAAIDTDGSSIDLEDVDISGYIDRQTPGTYEVTFTVTGPESGKEATATMMVTVQSPDETESSESTES